MVCGGREMTQGVMPKTPTDPALALGSLTMGSRWSVLIDDDGADPKLQARLQAAVDEVDAQMSTWKPDSASAPAGPGICHHAVAVLLLADAMVTALMIMGDELGPDFAKDQSISALFLRRSSNGTIATGTGAFAATGA